MNSTINREQNKAEYLRYRYVSRKLYTDEKKYRSILSSVAVVVYILGLIPNMSEFLLFVPVLWLIVSQIIKIKLSNTHKKAVDYHEYNDREMFGLTKLTKLIDNYNSFNQEAISITTRENEKKKYEQMIKKEHKISIRNWYSNFRGIPSDIAIIMAQDENINWEKNQREIYRIILMMLIILVFGISTTIIYLITKSFSSMIYAIPIAWDCVSLYLDNNETIKRCDFIIEKIGTVYNKIKYDGKNYNHNEIIEESECIQFKIYENRKESIPVPDIIYKVFRKKMQSKSDDYIKAMKNDIKNNLK